MKKLLFILLTLPIISLAQEDEIIDSREILYQDDLAYLKRDSTLLDGLVKIKNEKVFSYDKATLSSGVWKDGRRDGVHKVWYENGQLKSESVYKDGKIDGLYKAWHDNGQLGLEMYYNKGVENGYEKNYSKNGNIYLKGNWIDGKRDGEWLWNDMSGVDPEKVEFYNKGVLEYGKYYFNGYWKDHGAYVNGEKDGAWRITDNNERVIRETTYKGGKKNGIEYEVYEHARAVRRYEGTYKDDLKDGAWKEWYENGQLKSEENYKDGKRERNCKTYLPDGRMTETIYYNGEDFGANDGKSSEVSNGSEKLYYQNGNMSEIRTYKNGQRVGVWKKWYKNGQLRLEVTFEENQMDGFWKEWYENGQLKSEGTYKDDLKDGAWKEWYEIGLPKSEIIWKYGNKVINDVEEIPNIISNPWNYRYNGFKKQVSVVTEFYYETRQESGEWVEGDLNYRSISKYDKNGNLIEKNNLDTNGNIKYRINYKYIDDNTIEESHYRDHLDHPEEIKTYKRVSRNKFVDSDDNDSYYEYLEKGLISNSSSSRSEKFRKDNLIIFFYDFESLGRSEGSTEFLSFNEFGDWDRSLTKSTFYTNNEVQSVNIGLVVRDIQY